METLSTNPAFNTYALCSAILALKMLLSAFYTGLQRQRTRGYANPEDARFFGGEGAPAPSQDAPQVAHALRIQRNDLENIPAFFAIGLIYVLTGASALGASAYFWVFTVARVLHTIFYMNHVQPWRAISYGVGTLSMLGMITHVAMATL